MVVGLGIGIVPSLSGRQPCCLFGVHHKSPHGLAATSALAETAEISEKSNCAASMEEYDVGVLVEMAVSDQIDQPGHAFPGIDRIQQDAFRLGDGADRVDDDVLRRSRVFVDRRESAFAGVGDILQPLRDGVITEEDILGDLYDLVGGSIAARTSTSEITVFKNAGGGHSDLIASEVIYSLVRQNGQTPSCRTEEKY